MAIGIAEDTTSASHEYWCRLVATHLGRKRSLEARSVSLACVLPVSLACLNSQTSVVREAPVDRDSTWCANGIQCASRKARCFRQQVVVACRFLLLLHQMHTASRDLHDNIRLLWPPTPFTAGWLASGRRHLQPFTLYQPNSASG